MSEGRSLLVGFDGSEASRDGLVLARQLAGMLDLDLHLISVFTYGPIGPAGDDPAGEALERDMGKLLEAAMPELEGIDVKPRVRGGGAPAQAIAELAEKEGSELIVLGSPHHSRIARAFGGSVAQRVLSGAPCPVAIAPHGYADHFAERPGLLPKSIGVAYDGSAEADAALGLARELARAEGSKIRIVSVVEPEPPVTPTSEWAVVLETGGEDWVERVEKERTEQAEAALEHAVSSLPGDLEVESAILHGIAPQTLVDWTRREADLMCVGSRGYGPLRRVLLGSVSGHLIREAPCPVIVTPRGASDEDA